MASYFDGYIGGDSDDEYERTSQISDDEEEEYVQKSSKKRFGEDEDDEEEEKEGEGDGINQNLDDDDDDEFDDNEEDELDEELMKQEYDDLEKDVNTKVSSTKQPSKKSNRKAKVVSDDEDDDDDDDDDDFDVYLQKFDDNLNKNYILNNHPECVSHNYKEVSSMCKVIRDVNDIIIDDLHKTLPYLTKYEKAKIIGLRAKQINSGATPFINVKENIIDGYIIAEMELKEKKIPYIIKRPMPNGGCEYWHLKDLEDLLF